MKRKVIILGLVFSLIFSLFAVTAFGAEEAGEVLPFAENEEIVPVNPELEYGDEDLSAIYEELFGESGGIMLISVFIAVICVLLFTPLLIIMIIFLVLNSKTKRNVKDYQRMFGAVPQASIGMMQSQYQVPVNNYPYQSQAQSVNPTGVPFGSTPGTVNINEVNNEQGGQI